MVDVAQLVRAPDCGSGCRGFEPHLPPPKAFLEEGLFFCRTASGTYGPSRPTSPSGVPHTARLALSPHNRPVPQAIVFRAAPRPFLLNFFLTQYLFLRARQSVLRIPHFVFPSSIAPLHTGLLNQPHTLTFSVTRSSGPRPSRYTTTVAPTYRSRPTRPKTVPQRPTVPVRLVGPSLAFPSPVSLLRQERERFRSGRQQKNAGALPAARKKLRIYSTTNCIPAIWTPHKSHEGHSPYEAPASRR